ncbi:hypothetical protein Tsubulata_038672 [Turnera subulata]|uniref:Scarecrow-like protein 14 n=1 Tax=Turnera subulata TaxID=218843 RepID=A0A9Q0FKM7_9ROSI|nr:hypothetical protein Tsubulata_038672 [Turnera subulata]
MVMGSDARFTDFTDSVNGFKFEDGVVSAQSSQYTDITNGFPSSNLGFNFLENPLLLPEPDPDGSGLSSIMGVDVDSPSDDTDFSETVLNYINQMLMEENMEEKPCMFHDPLALQAAEKSLYDVLGEKYPPSTHDSSSYGDQFLVDSPDNGLSSNFSDQFLVDSPDNGLSSNFSDCSANSSSTFNGGSSVDTQWNGDFVEVKPSFMQTPLPTNFVFQSTATPSPQSSSKSQKGLLDSDNKVLGPSVDKIVIPNMFSESELALQFKKGVEEASKFLPKVSPLVIDVDTYMLKSESKERNPEVEVKVEKEDREYMPSLLGGKKNHHDREDEDLEEGRSKKQSAVSVDETELSEMFDKVLVCSGEGCRPPQCMLNEAPQSESNQKSQQNGKVNGSNGGKSRTKKQSNKKDVIDLRTLLILCAQAVSSNDCRTANELLRQIRQHSSPFGDGSQRLAHCFANALEARLAGTGAQIYTALSFDKTSAADMLKAYHAYISTCPFKKMAIIFANHNILKAAENATTLHIIDFGILYGFQWPGLIYRLSRRAGGPPKLRITGIELPQSGFRPAERVQETGVRLANYCERHNVPFEYNGIAQKWETIQLGDLKINDGEVVVVNCLFRFKNLLDETVVVNSPKTAVLNLIRKINPKIFIHAIVNGSYSAPFFVTRFREALFHFSALFDMCDTNMPQEDPMRLKFEEEFYGREAMNVIGCEGSERVERPETYKQWQVRNMRAGLKPLPLDPLVMNKLKCKVKAGYHDDFVVDQDGVWMLQGNYSGYSDDYPQNSDLDEQQSTSQNPDLYHISENGLKFDIPSPDNFSFLNNIPPDYTDHNDSLSFSLSPDEGLFVPTSTSLSRDGESFGPSPSSSGWSPDQGNVSSSSSSSPSSSEDSESSDPVLKYISQMLMEENMEEKPHMFYDPFTLKATEKSLYDVLGEQYPPSLNSPLHSYINHESPDSYPFASGSDLVGNTSTSPTTSTSTSTTSTNSAASVGTNGFGEKSSLLDQSQAQPSHELYGNDEFMGSSASKMVQSMFSDEESVLQFKRGLEEASKFLPCVSQLVIDLESNPFSTERRKEEAASVMGVKQEKIERANSPNNELRVRKNHEREDLDLEEGRTNKQSAVYVEEGELSEKFDKILLWRGGKCDPSSCEGDANPEVAKKTSAQDEKPSGSNGGKSKGRKQGKKKETVDLRALLILCAQAVSSNDGRTASEMLKQIREHSSSLGDGTQRLAHYFANGLEARLAGSAAGMQEFFTSLVSKKTTAADMLNAYKTHLHSTPFKKLSMYFANKAIVDAAEKATTLHIVDFGVLYGFQWPILIQLLSERPGGPPKLRMTGIELPQHGFRPAERIEETGKRLAKYCQMFSVPFEYNPIAAKDWESIPMEALKLRSNEEVLAVNCLGRFKNLFDETVEANYCPRAAVLDFIRRMNPDIFVHTVVNGSYNAPFFLTRFREALFHFSSLFDMLESTLPREDQGRLMFESELYGREAMNAVACEGRERTDRPETYKQWQARTTRAGFKSLPLDQEQMTKFKDKVKNYYHKDFVIDQDNNWLLQGWKGRIFRDHLLNGCRDSSSLINHTPSPFSPTNPDQPCDSTSYSADSNSVGDYTTNNVTLKYISDMLMEEEDLESKPCMLQDCLALQAAEKSFYDVLVQDHPPPPPPPSDHSPSLEKSVESPDASCISCNSYPTVDSLLGGESNWILHQDGLDFSHLQQSPFVNSPESTLLVPDLLNEIHPLEVNRRGVGEENRSPSDGDSCVTTSESNSLKPAENQPRDYSPTSSSSRGRKNYQRGNSGYLEGERSNKQSAISAVEVEDTDLFDKVLLCPRPAPNSTESCVPKEKLPNGASNNLQKKGSNGRTGRPKKRGSEREVVDLSTLLTQCAQAVAIGDQRNANELLQQIRQHSSRFGDGNQRLAYWFANALEARLAGSNLPPHTPIVSSTSSAAKMLKAYHLYIRTSPFLRMTHFFANRTILKLAQKATRLHIIDFGILYGFQWPCLIQRLSERPQGPPKLRVTGIELPQPGFRPAERVEETGRRLQKYCQRFGVPFEYKSIAQKWETIKYEDLNIDRDEVTVVNCLHRLRNIPDDTVALGSPRDTVLTLIERIKPDIFIHGVWNGTYNAPFFVTRFREALFHFSSMFDMFEKNVPREDEERLLYESENLGRDIMNVVACEGAARVERPETYKQWQARNLRAGLRQLPLDQELFSSVRSMVKSQYDKDFVVDQDGQWMLQGWKGRIILALSFWKPVHK